jgi:hypothetical protein
MKQRPRNAGLCLVKRALFLTSLLSLELATAQAQESRGTFPYQRDGQLILVEVSVDEHAPALFVLDSGAPHTVLDPKFAKELGLDVKQAPPTSGTHTDSSGEKMRTIVGVVPRLKLYGYSEPELTSLSQGYLPQTQQPNTALVLLLRTSLPTQSLEPTLRQIVASLDSAQPVFDIRTMQERVEETWATPRLLSFLLTMFAGLALALAAVGLFGVMAYNSVRRTREIGVRLAFGARRRQIATMILRQGMRLLAIGLPLGFIGAIASSRVIRSLLFQVSRSDEAIFFIAVTLVLAAVAALACWIPARRASRVDPMVALRYE